MTLPEDKITILIVDDHNLARVGLSQILQMEDRFSVVGEAIHGAQAIDMVREKKPSLVLMDIEMPVMDGVEATREIKKQFPEVKVVMLTSQQNTTVVLAALASGADSYCMKDIEFERLVYVLALVAAGGVWLDPPIAQLVLTQIPNKVTSEMSPSTQPKSQVFEATTLTKRELEILDLIAKGFSNPEIAETLVLSLHTVKTHVCHILDKLAVDDRTHAAVKAMKAGWVSGTQIEALVEGD